MLTNPQVDASGTSNFKCEVLGPEECRRLMNGLNYDLWVYRYSYRAPGEATDWVLSVATLGEPDSGKLSLGGLRIVPKTRSDMEDFDCTKEAISLAVGMEEKVFWSRLLGVAGAKGISQLSRIVGGKCVLLPSENARVGHPRDKELLNFAATCLHDIEQKAGIHLTTGQDLGHGVLSDESSTSLLYLHKLFPGSVLSDTSKPTAEGNYYVLKGMLSALGISLNKTQIGLIGCGNVGRHLLGRIMEEGAIPQVLELSDEIRSELELQGISVWKSSEKERFLKQPLKALVVNSSGSSLDGETIDLLLENPEVRVICGSENLALPNLRDAEKLWQAEKVYCPTELAGMMGYLTAVEEYLCQKEKTIFDIRSMYHAAEQLEAVAKKVTKRVVERSFQISFEHAVEEIFCAA